MPPQNDLLLVDEGPGGDGILSFLYAGALLHLKPLSH